MRSLLFLISLAALADPSTNAKLKPGLWELTWTTQTTQNGALLPNLDAPTKADEARQHERFCITPALTGSYQRPLANSSKGHCKLTTLPNEPALTTDFDCQPAARPMRLTITVPSPDRLIMESLTNIRTPTGTNLMMKTITNAHWTSADCGTTPAFLPTIR